MKTVKRRTFLSQFSCLVGAAFVPLSIEGQTYAESTSERRKNQKVCWLDVTAPFVIENSQIGLHSEIVLTSDTFNGIKGHEDGTQLTDYEVYLYDSSGKAVAREGVAKRLTVPAMHTTVFSVREILGEGKDFFGGMKIIYALEMTLRCTPATCLVRLFFDYRRIARLIWFTPIRTPCSGSDRIVFTTRCHFHRSGNTHVFLVFLIRIENTVRDRSRCMTRMDGFYGKLAMH